MIPVLQLCKLLDHSRIGVEIRESSLLFPAIEGLHVLALTLSVGLILICDLRLIGAVLRKRPASEVWNQFFPWMMSGFALMFITGTLLFWSHAEKAYYSFAFRTKLALLVLSAVNAAVYHLTIWRSIHRWDAVLIPPLGARLAGWLSLILWAAVITTGRIMAYSF